MLPNYLKMVEFFASNQLHKDEAGGVDYLMIYRKDKRCGSLAQRLT
jgi:hypothetical protein